MDTLYSSRVGATPNQTAQNFNTPQVQPVRTDPARQWADRYFGSTPYQGQQMQRNAPRYIYGREEEVDPNIQQETSQMPPAPSLADRIANTPMPQATMPDESAAAFQNDDTMTAAGLSPALPVTMPKDPTNGQKTYTPEGVKTGSDAITFGMQNNLPAPQSPVQAQTQAADHDRMQNDIQAVAAAKNPKTAWKEMKQDPFYKNSDFYTGLMNVGLAIMSGANPMQAFQAGKGAMDKATLSTQMGQNRQALIDAGYSPASIEAAITSGDQSKLQMQQMSDEDRMQAEDARWAKQANYSNDLEQQRYERNRADTLADQETQRQFQAQQAEAQDRRYQQRQADQLAKSKALIDYRGAQKKAAAEDQAKSMQFDYRELNAEGRAGGYATNQQWTDKAASFQVAQNDLQQAREAKAAGDAQGARSGYQQTMLNTIRGEVGPGKSLQPEDVRHFGGDPSMWVQDGNNIVMKSGAAPTDDALDYLDKSLKIGLTSANHSMEDFKRKRINSLVKTGWDPKRATAIVNQRAGGEFFDPLNAFGSELTDADKQGALSGLGGGDLNGF